MGSTFQRNIEGLSVVRALSNPSLDRTNLKMGERDHRPIQENNEVKRQSSVSVVCGGRGGVVIVEARPLAGAGWDWLDK